VWVLNSVEKGTSYGCGNIMIHRPFACSAARIPFQLNDDRRTRKVQIFNTHSDYGRPRDGCDHAYRHVRRNHVDHAQHVEIKVALCSSHNVKFFRLQ
jgi:hypothetical protein